MWVFGYGSLMWDGWDRSRGCFRRVTAELSGYRRTFNKASVKNWGTIQRPGPTLNLEAASGALCKGLAFEFPDEQREGLLAYLKEREGQDFAFPEFNVRLECGQQVEAIIPVYAGKNLIDQKSLAQRVEMVRLAVGTDGPCIDYVKRITKKLAELGIDDPAVSELWGLVQQVERDHA